MALNEHLTFSFIVFKSLCVKILFMKTQIYPAGSRGSAEHGWLHTRFSFSFAEYYDPSRVHFGMLRVLNDDIIEPGQGFGTHPHQNMEIITIPHSGVVKHKDSTGGEGLVSAGEIQVMSAGSGIYHSEFNGSDTEMLSLFQIWIFPREKNIKPRYDQKLIAGMLKPNELQVVVSGEKDTDVIWINQDAWLSLGKFDKVTKTGYQLKRSGNGVFMIVIEGSASINGNLLEKRDAIEITATENFEFEAHANSYLLVIEVPMN